MRHTPLMLALVLAAAAPRSADAQAETDRLREALRSCTVQLRSSEDQRGALQAKLTEAERERDRLRSQNDALRAQVKDAEQSYRQAVKEFNDRIGERDETLEKWKAAYEEAATVARTKDAERAQFERQAATLKDSNKSCEAKNTELEKVGNDLLSRYEQMNPLEPPLVHEPVLGLKRVEHQNSVQDYRDKFLDQKVKP